MKQTYWIAPLVALLIFAVGYGQFRREQRAREQARTAQLHASRSAHAAAEIEARRQAVVEAVRVQALRQKEREDREAHARRQQEDRQRILAARDSALKEHQALSRQLALLKQELTEQQRALAQLAATRRNALAEQVFLSQFLLQAEANGKALAALIAKLPPAESGRSPAGTATPGQPKP
jgi:hypothetical protein